MEAGRSMDGLDIFGADVFHGGNDAKKIAQQKGLLGSCVYPISDGVVPFEDDSFDLVISNQVFEHVNDLEWTSRELARITRSGGRLLTIFPHRGIIREAHCGIPLAHRFARGSRIRHSYMLLMRSIGLGFQLEGKTRRKWVSDFEKYLDRYTFYRSRDQVEKILKNAGFSVTYQENEYISFRLRLKGVRIPETVGKWVIWRLLATYFCRLRGGLVMEATRREKA